jgi:hypothetical protein
MSRPVRSEIQQISTLKTEENKCVDPVSNVRGDVCAALNLNRHTAYVFVLMRSYVGYRMQLSEVWTL